MWRRRHGLRRVGIKKLPIKSWPTLFSEEIFVFSLFPTRGQSSNLPIQLARAAKTTFREDLADIQNDSADILGRSFRTSILVDQSLPVGLAMVGWCRCRFSEDHLAVQWARVDGCDWDSETREEAARGARYQCGKVR